jgi:hypothetical protein
MRFTAWLWDQLAIPGPSGKFAKLCWDDVNNGCASVRFTAAEWVRHFRTKHPETQEELTDRLVVAYGEYMLIPKQK